MRGFLGFLLGLLVGAVAIAGTVRTWQQSTTQEDRVARPPVAASPEPPARVSPVSVAPPAADVRDVFLVARMRDATAWDTVMLVDQGNVQTLAWPDAVDRTVLPVTDGRRLYAYVGTGLARRLVAFTLNGREEETVTDGTDLVEPRGLFAAPIGAYLAFFLDSRQTTATELWTYDTTARTKRVSVEHLDRADVTGPFFSADGSFLLRSGARVLRGSPRRTGADIVPSQELDGADERASDGTQLPASDGSAIAFLTAEGGTTALNVFDVSNRTTRRVATLPAADVVTGSPPASGVGDLPASGAWYQVVQFLRLRRGGSDRVASAHPFTLSPEVVLQTVEQRLRKIADAPVRESVSAERVWFTTAPDAVYVDYRIGTTLWRRLVRIDEEAGAPRGVTVLGVFAAAEGEWVLARGTDLEEKTPTALYEFEPDVGRWIEKPLVRTSL